MEEKSKLQIKLIVAHRPTIADIELHQAKVTMLTFQSIEPPLSSELEKEKEDERN